METGIGKTYCYIKTMYEMNKKYGWSKFIIMVPTMVKVRAKKLNLIWSLAIATYLKKQELINQYNSS